MQVHFADRLCQAIEAKGNPCVVALDPVYAHLPSAVTGRGRGVASINEELDAIIVYSRRVLNLIAPIVPAVKINSAYFERYHAAGVQAYDALIAEAAALGLLVIGDVKRGDVGHTAEQYARAHLEASDRLSVGVDSVGIADAVTVNGYFGADGVRPFIDAAKSQGRGVFVLVRTSNPSAAGFQDVATSDGRKVHELVAAQVSEWSQGPGCLGSRGYSLVGAVVATRNAADARHLRRVMPRSFFLVPGYGAQGGAAADFVPYFNADGFGALIAAGRSVIFSHQDEALLARHGGSWEACVAAACRTFAADVAAARGASHGG